MQRVTDIGQPAKHGLKSDYALTGDDTALTQAQRGRLAELRELVAAPGGVRLLLHDRVAKACLVAEWAEAWLQQQVTLEGAAKTFERGIMARYFTASAEARRALVELARLPGDDSSVTPATVLESLRSDNGE